MRGCHLFLPLSIVNVLGLCYHNNRKIKKRYSRFYEILADPKAIMAKTK